MITAFKSMTVASPTLTDRLSAASGGGSESGEGDGAQELARLRGWLAMLGR
eukprot:SAG22_NODE_306_length_12671_cov_14.743239_6_plen_51_part_00